jgi:hypothetical protein
VSRYDAALAGLEENDVDEIDPLTYARALAGRVRAQLQQHAPTDPGLLGRLERDLVAWDRLVDELTIEEHWSTGEGDRRLF